MEGLGEVKSSKEMKDIKKQKAPDVNKENEISRRQAMTRMGLAAFSAATMLLLLNQPGKAQTEDTSTSPDDPDTW
jgi:hypothetical protein